MESKRKMTDEEILNEINNRLKTLNDCTLFLSKISKTVTVKELKEIIPDMITCRFPENSKDKNKTFCFIQFQDVATLNRNMKLLSNKKIDGKPIKVQSPKEYTPFKSLDFFAMNTLYFNFQKPETHRKTIELLLPNAKIVIPQYSDKSIKGNCILIFNSESETMDAFMKNNLVLNKIKIDLNFLLKKNLDQISMKDFSFDQDDNLFEEMKYRVSQSHNRSLNIKNLPFDCKIDVVKKLFPTMTSCKLINQHKQAIIRFNSVESTVTALNKFISEGHPDIKASHKNRKIENINSFDDFVLNTLYVSNLTPETTPEQIQSLISPKSIIKFDKNSDGSSIGYCIIDFEDKIQALNCFNKINNCLINEVPIEINFLQKVALKKFLKSPILKQNESVKDVQKDITPKKITEPVRNKSLKRKFNQSIEDSEEIKKSSFKKAKVDSNKNKRKSK